MAAIPGFLLRHEALVEPYLGAGPAGDAYGPGIVQRCFAEPKRRRVRSQTGNLVVAHTTVWFKPDVEVPTGSRVTVLGQTGTVISADLRDGGGLPTPDHIEVVLA